MNKAKDLIEKYKKGQCTAEELEILYRWFDTYDFVDSKLSEEELLVAKEKNRSILSQKNRMRSIDKKVWIKIAAASIMVFGLMYLFTVKYLSFEGEGPQFATLKSESILLFEDGKQFELSNLDTLDQIEITKGIQLSRDKDGFLKYTFHENAIHSHNAIQTVVTAVGEQESLIMPDGTKLWLNSGSKLSFSLDTYCNGMNREMTLEGEAFFDVAKRNHPITNELVGFWVYSQHQIVKVLGTSFNVSAYKEDADVTTTLVTGRVELDLSSNGLRTTTTPIILKPGQQSKVNTNKYSQTSVDVLDYVFWKDGVLYLDDQSIYSIMRSISRWYPIQVAYEGNFDDITFGGTFSKHKKLDEILEILESTGHVKFEIYEAENRERRILVKRY